MQERIVGSCAASCTQDAYWTEGRRVFIVDREGIGSGVLLSPAPVPGVARIVRFTRGPDLITLESGERFLLSGSAWLPIGSLIGQPSSGTAEQGTMRLRAVRGIGLGEGRSVAAGEVFEVPEAEGMAFIRSGRASQAESEPVA